MDSVKEKYPRLVRGFCVEIVAVMVVIPAQAPSPHRRRFKLPRPRERRIIQSHG